MAVAIGKAAAAAGGKHAQMLIDGAWVEAVSGKDIPVESPGNRQTIGSVPRGGAEDIDRAVKAATNAFPAWSRMVPRERGRILQKVADVVEARVEELARIVAEETGNAIRTQARPEAKGAADILRYFGGLASELKGETIPLGEHVLSYTRREPIGVVGAIIPWNAPVILGALKIAPALCAGNTLVLKAAEDAPMGVLWLAAICNGSAQGRAQRRHRLWRGSGSRALRASRRAQALFHRLDRGRQAHHARGGRPHRPRIAGARRQEPLHRLSRRQRGLGGRRHHLGHALHPPEPVVHRRLAPFPARRS